MSAQTVALIFIAVLVAMSSAGGIPPDAFESSPPPYDEPELTPEGPEPNLPSDEDDGATAPAKPMVLGYFMQDGTGAGRNSLLAGADALTAVSPWSWGLTKDGRLRPVYFQEHRLADTLALAGSLGLDTHLLIHNFDPDKGTFDPAIADEVLTRPEVRDAAVEHIVAAARSWGVDGVHIDFEGVSAARRNDLTAFMKTLRQFLSAEGIGLSIAVPAKTFATADSPWTAAYDYEGLARHVDFLMIMAYDQHWPGGPPGPVAALPWVRGVVEYAVSADGGNVPSRRIVLGMAAYGYDWPLNGGGLGESVTFAETSHRLGKTVAQNPGAAVHWHDDYASPYLNYAGRQIWFENAGSLSYKMQLALDYDLGGVALWRLGQEDPALWGRLASFN